MSKTETIFGLHASIALLTNPERKVVQINCTNEFFKNYAKLLKKFNPKIINILDRKVINNKLDNNIHQGIFVVSEKRKMKNLDSLESNEEIVLMLDSLNDSQNVGSILRTAFLFGVRSVIFNKDNSFKINPFLIKAASGAYEGINLIEATNLVRSIEILKKKGYWIVGLDINSKNNLEEIPKKTNKVFVFGSEKKGIRKLILNNCDFLAKIDLPKKNNIIDSLNVSNSVAIVLNKFQ